jgi:hypothetical protein
MSATGQINTDPTAIMRRFTVAQDSRVSLSRTVRQARKATRYRPSTLVTRRDPSIMHPFKVMGSSWEMDMMTSNADAPDDCRRQHSFSAGGAVRISDMHK